MTSEITKRHETFVDRVLREQAEKAVRDAAIAEEKENEAKRAMDPDYQLQKRRQEIVSMWNKYSNVTAHASVVSKTLELPFISERLQTAWQKIVLVVKRLSNSGGVGTRIFLGSTIVLGRNFSFETLGEIHNMLFDAEGEFDAIATSVESHTASFGSSLARREDGMDTEINRRKWNSLCRAAVILRDSDPCEVSCGIITTLFWWFNYYTRLAAVTEDGDAKKTIVAAIAFLEEMIEVEEWADGLPEDASMEETEEREEEMYRALEVLERFMFATEERLN